MTISVVDAPSVTITDNASSEYTNAAVTFTFTEPIVTGGFTIDDITVDGDTPASPLTTIIADQRYTLGVPLPTATTNVGVLTVRVRADSVTGMNSGNGNPEVMVTQRYDTEVPVLVDGDDADGDSDNATDSAVFLVGDPVTTVVYDATAIDEAGTGMADENITYTLTGGASVGLFEIDPDSGEVTYISSPTSSDTHTIVITATDKGGNIDTITVTVTAAFSDNANLSALTVTTSGGTAVPLSPAFVDGTTTYTANVRREVTSVTISTTTSRSDAMGVTFTGTAADGSNTDLTITATGATATVSGLTDGDNTIIITVTAADGTAMSTYTITLTRATDLVFTPTTVADQIFTVSMTVALTLPEAGGGIVTPTMSYAYTLTPTADIPAGLTFDSATRTLSGTPTAIDTRTLTYTVTDGATPPVSTTLTFSVMIVREITVAASNTADIPLDLDDDKEANDPEDGILILPIGHGVTKVIVGVPLQSVADNPPAGIAFSRTTDIALSDMLATNDPATVCLPIIDVPAGREPILYHYFTMASQTAETWNPIGYDTATRTSFVCGSTTTFSPFAVGYATATSTARLNEQILTRAAQAMTASTLEAVARRVEAGASSAGGAGTTSGYAYQFGGQSSLNGLLKSHGKAMLEDNMEYEQLFDGASFVVPLSAAEDESGDGKPAAGALSLWGSSNFINLGSDNDGLDWDGQVTSINVGVDRLVGEDMLAGFALSSNQSSFEYDTEGEYNYSSTLIHPYIGWFPEEDLKLWASVGFGSGEIEIDDDGKHSTGITQLSLSGGFSRWLLNSTELLSGGATTLNLKGDVSMTSVDVEANTGFAAQKVSSTRLRVLVSGEQQRELASGGGLAPLLEAGLRYDGGDGVTGVGVELGGGLRYANSGGNVTVAGNVRTLLAHDYDESGVDFLLQRLPSAGRGLSLSLHPVWGRAQSTADKL